MPFSEFIKNDTSFTFIPKERTPVEIPVSGIANIARLDSSYVIIKDKDNLANFIFGHIEEEEELEKTIIRESLEEAGIRIGQAIQIGYIYAQKITDTPQNHKYPNQSAMNVYYSFVTESVRNWKTRETLERNLVRYKKAFLELSGRKDNNQLAQILEYTESTINNLVKSTDFEFRYNKVDPDIPVTQVFNFAKNADGLYCLVKDYDEKHFSLPGGGCDLGESINECAFRETVEEAQLEVEDTQVIGVYVATYKDKDGSILHQCQHIRTISRIITTDNFVPRLNGFETIERKFVPKEELPNYLEWLKYEGGDYLFSKLD